MTFQEEFGDRMREARRVAGMSQAWLAGIMGVSPGCICNYERGIRGPSLETASVIAQVLGTTLDALVPPATVPSLVPGYGQTNIYDILDGEDA